MITLHEALCNAGKELQELGWTLGAEHETSQHRTAFAAIDAAMREQGANA